VTFSLNLGPINIVLQNENWTGGVQGINPIDPPYIPFFDIIFDARSGQLAVYLGLFLLLIAIVVARNLERSRIGRAWGALREDETAAEMMGVNTVRTKLLAFALGASFAGVAGSFQASYLGASTSDFFDFSISILVLIMVILGGIGNIWGAVLGAFALTYVDKTLLPYIGQRIGDVAPSIPNPAEYNFLIYGVILVLMMRFRPQGFLPSRQREAELIESAVQDPVGELGLDPDQLDNPELDNVELAPHGQSEVGPGARDAETPDEARRE
jgi:branched-chain amino acid transport system permease protein